MAVLSFVIAIPLFKSKKIGRLYNSVCVIAGLVTVAIGLNIVSANHAAILSLVASWV